MPDCDHCGETFGNEGAKSSHERFCDQNPANSPDRGDAETANAPEPQRADGGQQGAENAPATQQAGGQQEALEVGERVGTVVSGLTSQNPEERAKAESEAITLVSSGLARLGQAAAKRKVKNMTNARNTDDLQKTNNYPDCPECGKEIHEVPNAPEFPCPHCDTMLRPQ